MTISRKRRMEIDKMCRRDRKQFNGKRNDRPRVSYDESLNNYFSCDYPPRPLVEPMHQGHWTTVDDYVDLTKYE